MPKGSGTKLRETMVLQFAKESGGIVTVGELASATGIPLDDAKLMLEKMVSQGAADTEISQSGGLRYIFPGFTAKEGRSV
jgi:DNA-binding IclR family transcriptional regulator